MRLKALTPLLRTWDLRRSVDFYVGTLGFACTAHDSEVGWATLERDGLEIMLASPNAHDEARVPAFTGSLYFLVDDVDTLWRSLRADARICYPLETFDHGMREFAIFDDSGYLLQFGEPLDAR